MSLPVNVNFSSTIRDKISGMSLGLLLANNLQVKVGSAKITNAMKEMIIQIKEKFKKRAPAKNPVVSAGRRMYRRIGWEPTRYRPSSEALVRRILKGENLYRINNIVDAGNITSALFLLPLGFYDSDKIQGKIFMDVGRKAEEYEGISKNIIHASGKLILRDDAGVFGNPTADSKRTAIDKDTKNVLAIFFLPPEVEKEHLAETLSFLTNLIQADNPDCQTATKIQTCQ